MIVHVYFPLWFVSRFDAAVSQNTMSTAITAMSALCYCPRTHQHRGLLDTVGLSCYREWETYCLLQFEFSQSTNLITEQSRHLLQVAHPIYSSLSGRQAIPEQRYDLHSVYALFFVSGPLQPQRSDLESLVNLASRKSHVALRTSLPSFSPRNSVHVIGFTGLRELCISHPNFQLYFHSNPRSITREQ